MMCAAAITHSFMHLDIFYLMLLHSVWLQGNDTHTHTKYHFMTQINVNVCLHWIQLVAIKLRFDFLWLCIFIRWTMVFSFLIRFLLKFNAKNVSRLIDFLKKKKNIFLDFFKIFFNSKRVQNQRHYNQNSRKKLSLRKMTASAP